MSAEDVRKLHVPFGIYDECDSPDTEKYGVDGEPANGHFEIDDVGITCGLGLVQNVCRECDTTDGEVHEYTDEGE